MMLAHSPLFLASQLCRNGTKWTRGQHCVTGRTGLLEHHHDDIVRGALVEKLVRRVLRHVERRPWLDPAGGLLAADHDLQVAGRHLDGDLVVLDDLQRLGEPRRNSEPLNSNPVVVNEDLARKRAGRQAPARVPSR